MKKEFTMFIIVFLVLFSLFSGISYYIAKQLHRGFVTFFPKLRFWPVMAVVCTLTLLSVLAFVQSKLPLSADTRHTLALIGGFCMAIVLYLLLFTLAADLLVLISRLVKLPFAAHRLFRGFVSLGVVLLTGIVCLCGFLNARQLDHVSYEIQLQGKQDISDLDVVLISDLHLGSVCSEDRLANLVSEINALKPDLVCIAGDFFDTDFSSVRNPESALNTLRNLKSTYGIYACLGNHDGGETHGQMVSFLEQAGIRLLNDTYTVIDDRLILVGRMDSRPIGSFNGQTRQPLSDFFVREDPALPVIVLDHNPANIHEYGTDADLILCGHTHKGQMFPGSLITGLIYDVDYGHYQKDAQSPHVIVTSGVGYWGMPIRVGTNCEIVTIRFS